MGKWEKYIFKDIAKFIDYRGRTPKKTDKGIPLITAKNVRMGYVSEEPREYIAIEDYEDWMTRGIPNVGDILFTTEAPLGNVAELTFSYKIALAQRLVTFQPIKDDYISKFLKYYMLSPIFQKELWSKATGTTVKGIKTSILKKFEIPLPPLPEQQRIVAKLDGLFAKIDKAIGLLEANILHTQALMGSVLDEEFGKLAKKYKTNTLPDVVKKDRHSIKRGPFGSALKKAFFVEKGYKVYEQKNAIKNDFSLGHYYINDEKFDELKGFQVVPGDIIISCSGTIGKIAIAPKNIEKGIINQALLKISLDNSIITNDYFTYFFKNFVNQGELKTKGAAIKNIVSVKELKKIPFALPTLTEQNEIVKSIKQQEILFELVLKTQTQKLNHLKALKSSLLDQAFKGEL